MAASNRLRQSEIEAAFALINQCRECWADANQWTEHFLRGMCRLTGSAVGVYQEQRLSADYKSVEFLHNADHGWRDATARAHFWQLFEDHPNLTEFLPGCTRLAAQASAGRNVTVNRSQISTDRQWYASQVFNSYHKPASVDDFILSYVYNRHTDTLVELCAYADASDPPPTRRAKSMLALLNSQIAPLIGTTLATNRQLGLHGLSPRLRQTLELLLAARSEKQIALDLGLSRPTVHEYISNLYRQFCVEGRAELMAYFLRRQPASRMPLTAARPALYC